MIVGVELTPPGSELYSEAFTLIYTDMRALDSCSNPVLVTKSIAKIVTTGDGSSNTSIEGGGSVCPLYSHPRDSSVGKYCALAN